MQAWEEAAGVTPLSPKSPLERPIAALKRYKYLIVAVCALSVVAGVVASRLVEAKYEVRATIWIQAASPLSARNGPVRASQLLDDMAWVELFKSYRIADAVVRDLSLFVKPEKAKDAPLFANFKTADRWVPGRYLLEVDPRAKRWTLSLEMPPASESGAQTDSVGQKMGFKWQLPPAAFSPDANHKVRFTVATPRETSIEWRDRIDTRLSLGSTMFWLSLEDRDPQLAARTLNRWLDEYVKVAGELKKKNLIEFSKTLREQLAFAEQSLKQAEGDLERFKVNTITLPTEGGSPVAPGVSETRDPALRAFFEKKIEYDNLRHDTEDLERAIARAGDGTTPFEAALLIPSVAQSPGAEALRQAFSELYKKQSELTSARQVYTDEFSTVKELATAVTTLKTKTIPQLTTDLLTQLKQRQAEFDTRITGASAEMQSIPVRAIEEMRLRRAVAVADQLYNTLKIRTAEAQLAEGGAQPDVAVLDTATAPLLPSKNTTTRILLLAVVAGFAVAIGLALLLDLLDKRIRYVDQATNELGLAVAGAIPRIPKGGVNSRSAEQMSQLIESFRSLRMHVIQSSTHPGNGVSAPVSVAVSSPSPGDGKSLVSTNLALSFADAGMRTVLVDGDTRRGGLHEIFGAVSSPGLTEYLSGTVELAGVVQATSHDNLFVVGCGTRRRRSPELLTSPRLGQLIAQLRATHDVVIIDTPPLAAGIDGYAISAAAGQMLLVVRVGQTERRMAAAKLVIADRLPINIIGAVLNGVNLSGEYSYYEYAPGYAPDESENERIPEAVGD
jgi:capsular exopolysaccharide synthesis family protein